MNHWITLWKTNTEPDKGPVKEDSSLWIQAGSHASPRSRRPWQAKGLARLPTRRGYFLWLTQIEFGFSWLLLVLTHLCSYVFESLHVHMFHTVISLNLDTCVHAYIYIGKYMHTYAYTYIYIYLSVHSTTLEQCPTLKKHQPKSLRSCAA